MWGRKSRGLILGSVVLCLLIQICCAKNISRASFPKGFVFGTGSSAYQFEGAVKEDGKGVNIWDKYAHTPGKINDSSNGDIAVDQYHRYPEDIQLIKDLGVDAHRISIAWTRIYPNGTGKINQAGIDHYNDVINALLANGIEPHVSIYHWDLPQSLEDRYNGWLNPQSIKDYAMYAETCFKEFGDRIKYWITFNEPHTTSVQGYDSGVQAPGRCSISIYTVCEAGNSATEPYIAAHNMLRSHAAAVDIYRKKYQPTQRGSIGIVLDTFWYEPRTNSLDDIEATQRTLDWSLGWFLDPLVFGDYPNSMKTRVGNRLPRFTPTESSKLKGSFDFLGINHYTTWYATANNGKDGFSLNDSLADTGAFTLPFKIGKPIADRAHSVWLYIVPRGIRSLMNYIREKYGNPPIMITENGMDEANNPSISIKDALKDTKRIKYHKDYLTNLLAAIVEDGCNVKGYFVWSLMDNWEWGFGYDSRFGLYYVDFNDNLKRYAKDSVKWFKHFLSS